MIAALATRLLVHFSGTTEVAEAVEISESGRIALLDADHNPVDWSSGPEPKLIESAHVSGCECQRCHDEQRTRWEGEAWTAWVERDRLVINVRGRASDYPDTVLGRRRLAKDERLDGVTVGGPL